MIKNTIWVLVIGLLAILLNEFIHGFIRQKYRTKIFKLAQQKAISSSKQLVVFGDPYYGFGSRFYNLFMDGYGCGDETVDLTGAPNCPNGIKSDILEYLKTQKSNEKIIFISCVLEYIDPIEPVVNEIMRVAGSIDNVFIVTVNEFSLALHLKHHNLLLTIITCNSDASLNILSKIT
jgi:hypothetical protein